MVYRLIELTAHRQGFGALLAEGNASLAERLERRSFPPRSTAWKYPCTSRARTWAWP